jgi:FMN reductase
VRVAAVDGSPAGGGKTAATLSVVLAGAADAGATTELHRAEELTDTAGLEAFDAFVFGSPVYRASYATPMKDLLDRLPRGMWGEQAAPVTGRAAAIVMTGASWHHFLALDDLRNVLSAFFAAQVLSPGLYVPREGFGEDGELVADVAARARATGRALVELAQALETAPTVRAMRPQA